jgi:hypothetical protein
VTGFLQQLCAITTATVYCTTGVHFEQYLKTPPQLQLLTARLKVHKPSAVYFRVSKISRVAITLLHDGKTMFSTSADFPYGRHSFKIPALPVSGTYVVHLDATDLGGNHDQLEGTLEVSRQARHEDKRASRNDSALKPSEANPRCGAKRASGIALARLPLRPDKGEVQPAACTIEQSRQRRHRRS